VDDLDHGSGHAGELSGGRVALISMGLILLVRPTFGTSSASAALAWRHVMNRTGKGSFNGVGIGAIAVATMVICCAAPALLAGGLLASLGAVVGNPLVIALGVALVTGAVAFAVVHRRRRACCPPERQTG